jgi:hypothetical protein
MFKKGFWKFFINFQKPITRNKFKNIKFPVIYFFYSASAKCVLVSTFSLCIFNVFVGKRSIQFSIVNNFAGMRHPKN